MDRLVIEGFESLTEQQMFDMAIEHIGTTRQASMREDGSCIYGGSGCNAAVFLTEEGREIGDKEYAGYGWRTLVINDRVPNHNASFIEMLQSAHDNAAAYYTAGDDFMSSYIQNMANVAGSRLNTDKLKALSDSLGLN